MNKQKAGALWKTFFFSLVFLLLLAGGTKFWLARRDPGAPPEEREIILLPELKWGSYDRFLGEAQKLSRRFQWRVEKPGGESSVLSDPAEELPAGEMREALQVELAERRALLTEELQLRRRLIAKEIDSRIQQRKNHDEYLLQQAIEERRRQQAVEMADFQREKEKEYATRLAALRFKLEIPDLSAAERSRLAAEVTALEQELAAVIQQKVEAHQQELEQFAEARREATAVELEAYRRELEAEGKERLDREEQSLKEEFNRWVQRNEEAVQALLAETSEEKVLF
ncbi:MAG: hypothetical protein GX081_00285 [Firmicutes bacterium]|nr:hypothetical protein [Bacillota bacterium]